MADCIHMTREMAEQCPICRAKMDVKEVSAQLTKTFSEALEKTLTLPDTPDMIPRTGGDVMSEFREDLRRTLASAMFLHAINPSSAEYFAGRFGGTTDPVTKKDVAARFGADAAQAWQDARDAKARFFAAIRAQGGLDE